MARQNARRKKSKRYAASAASSPFSGMIWLAFGLLAGLLIATVFYLKQQHKISLSPTVPHTISKPRVHAVQEQAPQFDFYHILSNSKKEPSLASLGKEKAPKVTLQAPEMKAAESTNSETQTAASIEKPSQESAPMQAAAEEKRYMVQIASVRNYEDADKLKAQLSLMGFAVTIQKISSGDILLNRVVIGPYDTLAAAQDQQKRLRENAISSIVVKLASKD